ncbi:hypothetical protein [Novosphingobium album (ex Hu et al. 2023)]|uniref:Glycosyltransferase family 2 protein n=1 Tax=Novosphingobium album (ex Hu et al. 2023) TaxID=2930093 RepID=A0ABT0B6D5_9SPHN|nr:hypothetical protein [Novosphingobium album (ex Hu et al. 2023)]MCJ2180436.1 hypothetical protein [Novosphingobium album (ex Hu et al. 2023)]
MIVVISTFMTLAEALVFWRQNALILSRADFYWSVTIGDEQADVGELSQVCDPDRTAILKKRDRCYAEGWNNAVRQMAAQSWPLDRMRACFLGTGDAILRAPGELDLSMNVVAVGMISRNGIVQQKLPQKRVSFATLSAWTPSCLFPAAMLATYCFPETARIASDIDIFFECFDKRLTFRQIEGFEVGMEDGGLSSQVIASTREYRKLYENRYGFSILARIAEKLKQFRHQIRKY